MRKTALALIVGSIAAAVGGYFAYKRKDEILAKLSEIQGQLREAEFTEKTKHALNDVVEKLTSLVKRSDNLTDEEKAKEVAELEEKVKKLEEVVKSEG
ncbi:MAG: YtxH domain-containing protein [Hydrogenothermaceae bacterium]|nr:YtxH domain-containing protein [Hydrogenothermaceae bacterium]